MSERPAPNPDLVAHALDVQRLNLQYGVEDLRDSCGQPGDVLTSQGADDAPVWRMGTIGAADVISPGHMVHSGDVVIFSGKSGRTLETTGRPFTPDGIGADAKGTAQQLMDDHLADPSPHSQYLLASMVGSAALRNVGLGPGDVVIGSDPRLAPNRPPGPHAPMHGIGGSDPITPQMIGAAPFDHYHPVASATSAGFMSAADWTLLHSGATGIASKTNLGSIKVGSGLLIAADGTLSAEGGKPVVGNDKAFANTATLGKATPIAVEALALGIVATIVAQTATGQVMMTVRAQRFNGAYAHEVDGVMSVGVEPQVSFEVSEELGQLVLSMQSAQDLTLLRGTYTWV